eukprot:6280794-Amphidinium_carterae.2
MTAFIEFRAKGSGPSATKWLKSKCKTVRSSSGKPAPAKIPLAHSGFWQPLACKIARCISGEASSSSPVLTSHFASGSKASHCSRQLLELHLMLELSDGLNVGVRDTSNRKMFLLGSFGPAQSI